QHHRSNRVRKFVTTDCGCPLVVQCHNKGSCIQGPVQKLSWLHTNFITKQRIYLVLTVPSRSDHTQSLQSVVTESGMAEEVKMVNDSIVQKGDKNADLSNKS
ncbi:unnamed protein product, partial [Porites lobata]